MRFTTLGLIVHPGRADSLDKARQTVQCFENAGMNVCVEAWLEDKISHHGGRLETCLVDAVISLGGDGTFLRAAQHALKKDIPLLGINLGRVGFLTQVEHVELFEAARRLAQGDCLIETRMALSVSVDGLPPQMALNDVVISRGGYARLIAISAHISNDLVGRYIADGVIVASPTGSTGYSLSAGGPIISPDVPCMVITPICAHSLQHRPVVVSAKERITLRLDCEPGQGITLTLDGQDVSSGLNGHGEIAIERARQELRLIRFDSPHFFSLLRTKLTEWTR